LKFTQHIIGFALGAGWIALAGAIPGRAAEGNSPPLSGPVVHDDRVEKALCAAGVKLMSGRKFVSMTNLAAQLGRKRCRLELPRGGSARSRSSARFERLRPGVLVVASLYKCDSCSDWHVAPATGFVLTASGAFATCYHVADQPDHAVMVVMTGDGRIHGVREVLAADEARDVAILQLDGDGFTPLPLSTNAPVGSRVFVMGHPEGQFYTLTEGIVSRYFTGQKETGDAVMMGITADFGRGSSGGPVFNERGEVVALADNVVTSDSKTGAKMIFKNARPVQAVLDLISRK
jgi:S1-C subfamily serine protease